MLTLKINKGPIAKSVENLDVVPLKNVLDMVYEDSTLTYRTVVKWISPRMADRENFQDETRSGKFGEGCY